jgi:hypothetical protein
MSHYSACQMIAAQLSSYRSYRVSSRKNIRLEANRKAKLPNYCVPPGGYQTQDQRLSKTKNHSSTFFDTLLCPVTPCHVMSYLVNSPAIPSSSNLKRRFAPNPTTSESPLSESLEPLESSKLHQMRWPCPILFPHMSFWSFGVIPYRSSRHIIHSSRHHPTPWMHRVACLSVVKS